MRIDQILVPTDFSAHADKAFSYAIEFARTFAAHLEVFHAYDLTGWVSLYEVTFAEKIEVEIRETASKRLGELVSRANAAGIAVESHLALGTPSAAILDRAIAIGAQLIIMGTHGRSVALHVLLGSVAERTVREATCPVVTIGAKVPIRT